MSAPRPAAKAKAASHKHETVIKRVARRHHDDDHGGNWKVAFADFCLALMCLFLLLWVLGARDEESTRQKLHQLASSMTYDGGDGFLDGVRAPFDTTTVPREALPNDPPTSQDGKRLAGQASVQDESRAGSDSADSADSAIPTLVHYESQEDLHALEALIKALDSDGDLADNMHTAVTPHGLRVMLHDTARTGVFERGSTNPSKPFGDLLERMGGLFAKVGNSLLIIGHTDSVQYRSLGGLRVHSNWTLSSGRAIASREYLLRGGLASKQVLQVVGMADRAPLLPDTRAAANRRIEFLVLTASRARMLEAMYGAPKTIVPLMDGANAVSSKPVAQAAAKTSGSAAVDDDTNVLGRTLHEVARKFGLKEEPLPHDATLDLSNDGAIQRGKAGARVGAGAGPSDHAEGATAAADLNNAAKVSS
ncbi:flagellar motor protein MotB [Paraburkholderia hayleyella]|uniref:flagellar motor protein MotB n=1 Tax=Paraburkholderia hayleyella TaxID=2152889 RepID=UPI0012915956|nr:flagellar motor protein MotB [Paraburkholderia hayleyella]